MSFDLIISTLLLLQAVAVLGACGSVLLTTMTIRRSMDSIDARLMRMDSVLDQRHLANTTTVSQ